MLAFDGLMMAAIASEFRRNQSEHGGQDLSAVHLNLL